MMKRKIIFILTALFGFSFLAQSVVAYNTAVVAQYADDYWDRRNPDYDNFHGADCANFVSQCLIAGGMMLGTDEDKALFIDGVLEDHIKKGGVISTVVSLMPYIENFEHAEKIISNSVEYLNTVLNVGDVVVFGYDDGDVLSNEYDEFSHSAIVYKKDQGEILLAYHSTDSIDVTIQEAINNGNYNRIIAYHFPNSTETGQHVRFYGTGEYYGDHTLDMIVMDSGYNYEGYIIDSTDDGEQDLVVGENTSSLNGCAHFIKAYCSDAHKGIPDDGLIFGQPWTSHDPDHWAYWARLAVVYANQNNYSSLDTLQAIWYITDRSGSYNQILTGIGYASDGPDKNISGYYPPVNDNSIKLFHNKFNPINNETMSIVYNLFESGPVSIKIYTIDGTLVVTILNGVFRNAGSHLEVWHGKNERLNIVASGIYFLHIEAPGLKDTKKICVVK
ncbi:amidase domain-containing protein [bacterium]|nr:amidase domain-containing protein [bacterium]